MTNQTMASHITLENRLKNILPKLTFNLVRKIKYGYSNTFNEVFLLLSFDSVEHKKLFENHCGKEFPCPESHIEIAMDEYAINDIGFFFAALPDIKLHHSLLSRQDYSQIAKFIGYKMNDIPDGYIERQWYLIRKHKNLYRQESLAKHMQYVKRNNL